MGPAMLKGFFRSCIATPSSVTVRQSRNDDRSDHCPISFIIERTRKTTASTQTVRRCHSPVAATIQLKAPFRKCLRPRGKSPIVAGWHRLKISPANIGVIHFADSHRCFASYTHFLRLRSTGRGVFTLPVFPLVPDLL